MLLPKGAVQAGRQQLPRAAAGDAGNGAGAKVRQRVSPGHRGKGIPGLGATGQRQGRVKMLLWEWE